jgi:hypothetical protein
MRETDLQTRFRLHAEGLERQERSPLSVILMRSAADDLERGGVLAQLFGGIDLPRGQAPALRVLAVLHRLVLTGRAPDLEAYYPSVGGTAPPDDVWQFAEDALRRNAEAVRPLLRRSVQTNEPGRSTVLYGVLLWANDRYGLPVRLSEIGASAGLNLLAPDYGYRVDGAVLGDRRSALVFDEPWEGVPVEDAVGAGRGLRIAGRRGCDVAPVDPTTEDGRITLLSYIWPDELYRIDRMRAALAVARDNPPVVDRFGAAQWLARLLKERADGVVDVVWQSVVASYLSRADQDRLSSEFGALGERATRSTPLLWARMEPREDPILGLEATVRCWPEDASTTLAQCGDHGPPVRWLPDASAS